MDIFFVKTILILCWVTALQAQTTQPETCPTQSKFSKAVDSFLDVLTAEDPEKIKIKAQVDRLAGIVDEFESLVVTLTQKQEEQSQKLSDKIDELDGILDDIKGCTCSLHHDAVFHVSVGGTYKLNFEQAKQACIDRGATIATVAQLAAAQTFGLDRCAAGWLSDGSVRYPITMPRNGCGGEGTAPGIRSWGKPTKDKTYDVYCFH
ncbi:hyaluronan and proteoglycan link protein 3-like [Anneissia japonica]|uniref:hyaluronan and proteoglycan link protein 3-like n=1 Tax=Anneissia japonica TaxID=1529436 RepID=UPI0014257F51|nr:hyaluronan and proteoglycan link protein 3-like [Anneissia japonica]